ncbi:hypothetical protein KFK09_011103 [Dendrobium nobile]|uniref:Uncharacterized protein n=1 Tax=Dendrobium nobile TaxID=94219 RepID=A0A8T3BEQ7_DENNO|nr:hypothetical protein KFK09_011103 [Dendrobium nobile]
MFCALLSISLEYPPPMKDDGNILLGLFALTTRGRKLVGGHERRRDRLLARSPLLSSTSPCKMAAMKFRSRGSVTRRFLLSKRYLAYCIPIQLIFQKECIRERF